MDLDSDGRLDVLSGSWPGEIFLFRGVPGRAFAAPAMLKYATGETINIGGGVQQDDDKKLLIAGTIERTRVGGNEVVRYAGKEYRIPKGKQVWTTGTASAAHAVDWDRDGDLDLLVGDIRGAVHFVPNEGTPKAPAFGKERSVEAGGEFISVGGDAGPFCADWDGDGDFDLLVGDGQGKVHLFVNAGAPSAKGDPKLEPSRELVSAAEVEYGPGAPAVPTRGVRAKVCAADWNGDGRLDLLLGDFTTMKPDLPEMTAEEAAVQKKLREEYDALQQRMSKLFDAVEEAGNELEREKLAAEQSEVSTAMSELRTKLRPEYEDHGFVWLFLRRPATTGS